MVENAEIFITNLIQSFRKSLATYVSAECWRTIHRVRIDMIADVVSELELDNEELSQLYKKYEKAIEGKSLRGITTCENRKLILQFEGKKYSFANTSINEYKSYLESLIE